MFNYKNLSKRIKSNEGFRKKYYLDKLGNKTIGYGHLIKESEKFLLLGQHSKKKLDLIFYNDLRDAIKIYKKHYNKYKLSTKAQEVIIEMIFQLGIKGVLSFKEFNKHIINGNNYLAAIEMLNSKWYKQTPRRVKKLIAFLVYEHD